MKVKMMPNETIRTILMMFVPMTVIMITGWYLAHWASRRKEEEKAHANS
jgi:cytochrome c-type biogenesis protein CcmH/NrfF